MERALSVRNRFLFYLVCICLFAVGCKGRPTNHFQGYAEGEFLLMAAHAAGRLDKLWVKRGQTVKAGEPLFTLEQENEQAGRRETEARLRTAEARYANLTMSLRSSEIEAIRAELAQAESALVLSTMQLERHEKLFSDGFISGSQLDEARAAQALNRERVSAAEAKLHTARSSIGREKEIAAAKADVDTAKAALVQSDWRLSQRAVLSPSGALVQDTFYDEGEWVPAGSPVASLLPPENIKIRFFVSEAVVGGLSMGRPVSASCNGCSEAINAKISYISQQPEYTPPVIYSREQRTRLVFLVEAIPDPAEAARLHPGQPVDVVLK